MQVERRSEAAVRDGLVGPVGPRHSPLGELGTLDRRAQAPIGAAEQLDVRSPVLWRERVDPHGRRDGRDLGQLCHRAIETGQPGLGGRDDDVGGPRVAEITAVGRVGATGAGCRHQDRAGKTP